MTIRSGNWRPNWRDRLAYADHGDDLQAWAWEFLRRNPDYQHDYAMWARLPDSEDGSWTPKHEDGDTYAGWSMAFYAAHKKFPALEGETYGEYSRRTGFYPVTLKEFLLRKWEILFLEDPAKPLANCHLLDFYALPPYPVRDDSGVAISLRATRYGEEWMPRRAMLPTWDEERSNVVTFGFDLDYPIETQIEKLRHLLTAREAELKESGELNRKPISRGPQVEKRISLLRFIDAEAECAERREIIHELYDGWDNPTKTRQEAADENERRNTAANDWYLRKRRESLEAIEVGYLHLLRKNELPALPRNKLRNK